MKKIIIKILLLLCMPNLVYENSKEYEKIINENLDSKNIIESIHSKYNIDKRDLSQIVLVSKDVSNRKKLDLDLILSMIEIESSFKHNITNEVGAIGLMQVIPKYHQDIIKTNYKIYNKNNLRDIEININVGTDVLLKYLEINNNNLKKALKQYSGNSDFYYNKIMKNKKKY